MPALLCSWCHADLAKATAPKKIKPNILKVIFSWLSALLFGAIAIYLVYSVFSGAPAVPDFVKELIPGIIRKYIKFLQ
jgi:hypothetical protein